MGVLELAVRGAAALWQKSHNPKESTDAFILFTLASVLLVLLAGLMSGLTLGLLSLDSIDLEVRAACVAPPAACDNADRLRSGLSVQGSSQGAGPPAGGQSPSKQTRSCAAVRPGAAAERHAAGEGVGGADRAGARSEHAPAAPASSVRPLRRRPAAPVQASQGPGPACGAGGAADARARALPACTLPSRCADVVAARRCPRAPRRWCATSTSCSSP